VRSKKYQELENNGVTGDELREKIVEGMADAEATRGSAELQEVSGEIKEAKGETQSAASMIVEWTKGIALALVCAVVILQFIKPTVVQQHSMEPNFYTNDYLFISKQAYRLFRGTPQLGDVIVFSTEQADGTEKLLIKRVIGTPGDEISIAGGKVYLNGKIIDDSYTKDGTTNGDIDKLIVPSDAVFCLGDNRLISIDSRSDDVGLVSYEDILGKVVFRLLPLSNMGAIDNPYDEE